MIYRLTYLAIHQGSFFKFSQNQDTYIMKIQIRLSHIFCRCLITCSALVLIGTSACYAETVSVIKDGTNIRTGPSTNDQVAMELFQGYPLKVIEKKGDWLKVSDFENDSGWISKKLVGPGNTVIVSSQKAINMRSEPATSGAIIANIERGVVLTKISTKGDWIKVKHIKGTEGWIHKTLLWP